MSVAPQEQWNAAFRLLKLPLAPGFSFCLSIDAGLHRDDKKAWTPSAGETLRLSEGYLLAASAMQHLAGACHACACST